jgi:Sigma-70 region 2
MPRELSNAIARVLRGIVHRMLGCAAWAEQIVQDARLRWREADQATLNKARAWLVTENQWFELSHANELFALVLLLPKAVETKACGDGLFHPCFPPVAAKTTGVSSSRRL